MILSHITATLLFLTYEYCINKIEQILSIVRRTHSSYTKNGSNTAKPLKMIVLQVVVYNNSTVCFCLSNFCDKPQKPKRTARHKIHRRTRAVQQLWTAQYVSILPYACFSLYKSIPQEWRKAYSAISKPTVSFFSCRQRKYAFEGDSADAPKLNPPPDDIYNPTWMWNISVARFSSTVQD